MAGDSWYFAYGSNLLKEQKRKRTGDIRGGDERPRIATLKDYRLAFNKRGSKGEVFVNVVPCISDEVMGVVYRWDRESRVKMAEGYELGYDEQVVDVTLVDGRIVSAITFIASRENVCDEGRPSDTYLRKIVAGAGEHGLPEKYIRRIEQLAGASYPRSS